MSTKCSDKRLLDYIRRNPGLTTCQLTTLLRHDATVYTKTAFNARLNEMAEKNLVERRVEHSAVSDVAQAYRHYYLGPIDKQRIEPNERKLETDL